MSVPFLCSMVCAVLIPAISIAQVVPMTNNECSSAITVYEGINPGAPAGLSSYFYTNVGATSSSGSPTCTIGSFPVPPASDVWFNYTATATATMIFKTCTPPGFAPGTCTDTVISLFGPGPCPATSLIHCNDDFDFCGGTLSLSTVAAAVTSGATYRIRVSELNHFYGGPPGTFYLTIATAPLQNDVCEHPIALGPGTNGPFTNIGGTASGVLSACEVTQVPAYVDVWFTVGGCVGPVTISTCGSSAYTVLSVLSSCGGSEIACNDDDPDLVQTPNSSTVSFVTTTTAPYLVRVSVDCIYCLGSITLTVTWGGLCLHYSSPSGPGSVKVDMSVWYRFVAPYSGTAEASTCGFMGGSANFDTIISVWHWSVSTPCTTSPFSGALACNDDYCGLQSYVSFPIVYGGDYRIAIGGYAGLTGNYGLAITSFPAVPPNNFCSGATAITAGSSAYGETFGATTGGGDPVAGCNMTKDVWYAFTPTVCGTYTVTTCPVSDYDTVVAVWQGSCGALTQMVCNDDSCGVGGHTLNSTLTFFGVPGTTYYISVGGYQGLAGLYGLSVSAPAPPPVMLAFFNAGPGTLGYTVSNGPFNGAAFIAITLNHGAYPNGWFHGIDTTMAELYSEWTTGFPFLMAIGATCSTSTVGPFTGLPPGITAYGVAIGIPSGGSTLPTGISAPASGTVP